MATLPAVGIMTGDPNGIGPEVVVKAWASGRLKPSCRPLIVGSRRVVEQAVRVAAPSLSVRTVRHAREITLVDSIIDVLESTAYDGDATRYAGDLAAAGKATGAWSITSMVWRARDKSTPA